MISHPQHFEISQGSNVKNLFTLMAIFCLYGINAFACPGAVIKMNDDTTLTIEGFRSKTDNSLLSLKSIKEAPENRVEISDSHGKITHELKLLGTIEDIGGVIQASYLVKDNAQPSSEIVLIVRSNYMGNGAVARGLEKPDSSVSKVPNYNILYASGCH